LLRERIDLRYRETSIPAPPQFKVNRLPGAETVVSARFQDSPLGLPSERLRVLIVAGGQAAIVDVVAHNAYCWQKIWPSVEAMLASVRVDKKEAPPPLSGGPGPAGTALAGLYRGYKAKYVVDLLKPVGYGSFAPALHYYLFSANGWVHRCYDFPPGPNRDWRQFDFDAGQREDPENTGRYSVRGNQLFIQLGDASSEMLVVSLSDPNQLEIESVTYTRQN
jgi:hypothetical protein